MATAFNVFWDRRQYWKIYQSFLNDLTRHCQVEVLCVRKNGKQLWIPLATKHTNVVPSIDKSVVLFTTNYWEQYYNELEVIDLDHGIEITWDYLYIREKQAGMFHKWQEFLRFPIARFYYSQHSGAVIDYTDPKWRTTKWFDMYYDLSRQLLNIILNR